MTADVLLILSGVLLLLIGILGGGFEVKELRVPKVTTVPRLVSIVIGIPLLFVGVSPHLPGSGQEDAQPGGSTAAIPPSAMTTPLVAPAPGSAVPGAGTTNPAPAAPQASPVQPPTIQTRPPAEVTSPPRLVSAGTTRPEQAAELNRYEQVVADQLNAYAAALVADGYTLYDIGSGILEENASEDFEIVMEGGYAYAVVGVCDQDCDDLDLLLLDSRGDLVAEDTEEDDVPVVLTEVQISDTYRISAEMYTCSGATCIFGIGIFRK